ncbi:hypothetical protein SVAN01_10447 [Stagonosporopsis vannaccii]|nr:hypothetical protein SVAN01_10447 [Stagonosporopsis vannaccii]
MSKSTRSHLAIPTGIVRNNCQLFEARISAHQYEQDRVYISRAALNMTELIRQNRTYAGRLRDAEHVTLFKLPTDLVHFLRDHDNLYRSAVRNRSLARKARAFPGMDVIEQVTPRLNNIRTAYYLNLIETSRSETEIQRMMHDPVFVSEFTECTLSLQDEIFLQLIRLDQLSLITIKDLELENIGPDHNIDEFGLDIPRPSTPTVADPADPPQCCCICLSPWSSTHTPFRITICAHTVGRPCLKRWLNSTARNANLCPCCRTALCERRARKPKAAPLEQQDITHRLGCAITQLGLLQRTQEELFGPQRGEQYMHTVVEELNYRLFEGDVGFYLHCDWVMKRWGVRRVSWH